MAAGEKVELDYLGTSTTMSPCGGIVSVRRVSDGRCSGEGIRAASRKDMICAPATPLFKEEELLALVRDTQTNAIEWGYPLKDGIAARESVKPDSKLVEKLGMHFVRVVFDDALPDTPEPMLRIVTPSGKLAVIPADTLAPLGIDQVCYVKQSDGWKIMGFIGEGVAQ